MISSLAIFLILFYLVVFITQLIHYIANPLNKSRLNYLFLLLTLSLYVYASDRIPDKSIPLNTNYQIIIEWCSAFILVVYLVFFVNSFLNLKSIRKILLKSTVYFLIAPFLLFFVVPLSLFPSHFVVIKRIFLFVPFLYAIWFIYYINTYSNNNKKIRKIEHFKLKVLGTNVSCISLLSLAVSAFLNLNSFQELVITNSGFIILSLIYLLILILDTQKDYQKLAQSERKLKAFTETLQEKVRERTKELEDFIEQRTSTFISLAHETRTPITLIKNKIEEYSKNKPHNSEIESMKLYVNKLNKQISNILDIEKTLKGLSVYEHDKVIDLSLYIKDRIRLFESFAIKKQIAISNNIQGSIFIKVDLKAIDSLINNLIENAIKYTQAKGRIIVSLKTDNGEIYFSVKDNGVGIPKDLHQKIFEPYYHVPVKGFSSQGIGIGLFIVKNIVQGLKGDILLISELNEGSEFIVKLKQYIIDKEQNIDLYHIIQSNIKPFVDEEPKDVISVRKKPGILIVEDNLDLLNYLCDSLKGAYNIYVALNGSIALSKIKDINPKPDLILSDIMMDEMDGFHFFQKLKETEMDFIPIIYITAKANSIDRDKALEMGAVDYIYKPFEISEVKKKVSSIIKNSRKQRSIAIHNIKTILDTENEELLIGNSKNTESFESICSQFNISPREKEIIELAFEGKSYNDIADELYISRKTVDNHFQKVYKKIGVNRQHDMLNIFSANIPK